MSLLDDVLVQLRLRARFRWGRVTGLSPLMVQLDGDTAPLAPSDTLVDPAGLVVGDRVRCEMSMLRVVVHGTAGGNPAAYTRRIGTTAERTAYPYAREGLEWYDTDLDTLYVHDGSGWGVMWHGWKAWTPSPSGFSLGNGTLAGRYQRVGNLVTFILELVWGSTSSASGAVGFSTPVTPAGSSVKHVGSGVWTRVSGGIYPAQARIAGGSSIGAALFNSSGAVAVVGLLANNYPGAPATGDTLYLQGSYEV